MRSLSLGGAWVTATYGGRIEMDMQRACREIINEVDGSLGCIVIDTQTGLTVAAESRPGAALNATMVDLLSIISTNMFSGQMVRRFEEALDRAGASDGSFVREVQMTTAQTNQFMSAIPGWNGGLLVLITDKSVSLGLGWMALHRVVKQLGAPTQAPSQVADAPPQPPVPEAAPPRADVRPEPSPAGLAPPQRRQPITASAPPWAEARMPYQAPAAEDHYSPRPREDASPLSPLAAKNPSAAQPQPPAPAVAERQPGAVAQQPEAPSPAAEASSLQDPVVEEQPEALSAEAPPAASTKAAPKAAAPAVGPRMNMFTSRQRKKRGAK